jgi:hypothetical protein
MDILGCQKQEQAMTLKSVTTSAKAGTKSIRATVPEGAVAYLGIEAGDELEWLMESVNGKKVLIVQKTGPESQTEKALRIASEYLGKERGKKN